MRINADDDHLKSHFAFLRILFYGESVRLHRGRKYRIDFDGVETFLIVQAASKPLLPEHWNSSIDLNARVATF